jgi:hypothetical protein
MVKLKILMKMNNFAFLKTYFSPKGSGSPTFFRTPFNEQVRRGWEG